MPFDIDISNGISIGAVIILITNLAWLALVKIGPALIHFITDRIQNEAETRNKEDELDLADDKLSVEAKTFLNDVAKEHFISVQQKAENCQEDLANLRVQYQEAIIKQAELDTTARMSSGRVTDLEKSLRKANNDLIVVTTKITELQIEVSNLQVRFETTIKELEHEQEISMSLRQQNQVLRNTFEEYKTKINNLDIERRLLTSDNDRLKAELTKIKIRHGEDTDQLIRETIEAKIQTDEKNT